MDTAYPHIYVSLQKTALMPCPGNERKELIRWISTIPCREHHQTMGKDFMPKSGQWLLRNPKFIEWRKSSAKSMLWLHGIRKAARFVWNISMTDSDILYSWVRQE
jgi:hypothetical protein